jgi:hypothetical protein
MCGAALCSDHRFTDASRDAVYRCRLSSLSCSAFTPAQCCARNRRRPRSRQPEPAHATLLQARAVATTRCSGHMAHRQGSVYHPRAHVAAWPSCLASLLPSLMHACIGFGRWLALHVLLVARSWNPIENMRRQNRWRIQPPLPSLEARPSRLFPAGASARTTVESLAVYHRREPSASRPTALCATGACARSQPLRRTLNANPR